MYTNIVLNNIDIMIYKYKYFFFYKIDKMLFNNKRQLFLANW